MDRLPNFKKELARLRLRRTFKESIEPEEILLDATKAPELEEQKIEVPIKPRTFKTFLGLIIGALLILAGQAAYLQIVKGSQYQLLAERNRTRSWPIFASRGIIYDRYLTQLVYNAPSFDLVVTEQDLPRALADRQAAVTAVSKVLGMPLNDTWEQLEKLDFKNNPTATIASNLSHEKLLALESRLPELIGWRLEKNITRQYVDGSYFSHILGYLGKLDATDKEKNPDYFLTEKIGKQGLEMFYEKILRGQPGQHLIEVDALGKFKREATEEQPQDGQGLILGLDAGLQRRLYEGLEKTLEGMKLKRAAAVALDPQSGSVLAMVSWPSFDNNLFSQDLAIKDYEQLVNDPAQPLFNRVVSGQYAPGSTPKPLIASAALQEGVVTPTTKIFDSGELTLVNQYNPEIVYHFSDWKAHGVVDMYSAIAQSCDVYFYTIGGGYGKIEGLGIERLAKYFKLFGFSSSLGVDLPGENGGLVPSSDWKEKTKQEQWYTGDTYHLAIGQGDLLVTPLQLAAATAAVVNGGRLFSPHLVDKIIDSDKNVIKTLSPKILQQGFIDEKNLAVVKEGMRQAVTRGSARLLNNLPVAVGAKTGTAQVAGQANSNAWVTAFAPFDNPKIILAVLVENAGEGSVVAAPVANEALSWYFSNRSAK